MKFEVIKSVKTEQELADAFAELQSLCNEKGLDIDDYAGITGTEFSPLYFINNTCRANGELCTIIFMQKDEKADRLRLIEFNCKKATLTVVTDWHYNAVPLHDIPGAVLLFKEKGNTLGAIYFNGTLVKDTDGYRLEELENIGSCVFVPYNKNNGILGVYAYTGFTLSDEERNLAEFVNPASDDEYKDLAPMFRKIESSLDFSDWFDEVLARMVNDGYLKDRSYSTIHNLRLRVMLWLETDAFKGKER